MTRSPIFNVRLSSLLSPTRVSVIAHRGGSALRPENTVAAFDHGLALGAVAIECDVHVSRDGEVVVIHDTTLDRTTDATGPVSARTSDELGRVDAGFHFGAAEGYPYRGRGVRIPRLREVLDRYPEIPVVIEIKGDRPEVAERAVSVIRDARAVDRVIVGGFSQLVLDRARSLAPTLVTSASLDEVKAALAAGAAWVPPDALAFRLFQVPFRLDGQQRFGRDFVRAARHAGLPVQAWIIDDASDMRQLVGWGVTGIITDRPDVAVTSCATLHSLLEEA